MTAQNPNLAALSAAGVSVWLDDLSRDRLRSGNLQELIDTKSVVGVTTNPSIFQKALSEGHTYDAQIAELAARGADVDATIRTVTTDDVRSACDVLVPSGRTPTGSTAGCRSRSTRGWHTKPKTIQQAIELWKIVDRPNLFIKIPATKAGLPAISAVLAEGISVNVTLIFSVQRYREVMDAYLTGMEKARQAGHSLSKIHSVASFSSPGWTPKSTSGWTESARGKRSNCAARPVSPMPAWPMPPTGRSSKTAIVIGPSRSTAPGSSARCGLPPA